MEKGCFSCALYAFTKAQELYIQRNDQESAQALETFIRTCREGTEPREIVILANSIDMPAAQELGLVFEDMGFHVVYSFPKDFSGYQKTSNRIVVLGGPDAYEGVGDLVQRVLISSQEEMLRKMPMVWAASKPWSTDQLVVVIGGPDRSQTTVATEEYRDFILCLVCCS